MATDIKIDSDQDLVMVDGDFVLVTDGAEVAQSAGVRFRFTTGEWFLDRLMGTPLFEKILNVSTSLREKEFILRNIILTTEGVRRITAFQISVDRELHKLRIYFEAETNWGSVEVEEIV